MEPRRTHLVVTLGPATRSERDLRYIKDRGVNFVRVNLSHSSLDELAYFVGLAKKVGVPFMIDTEGSQIRTGPLNGGGLRFAENTDVTIYACESSPGGDHLCLRPGYVLEQLQVGDLIYIDFDTLILRVTGVSAAAQGRITARTLSGGAVGSNKAVVVDRVFDRRFDLPPLSPKDCQAIELGLAEGIEHIAVSFVRSKATIDEVRRATQGRMKIISKIECVDALERLDEIIPNSDFILIDRGDLSKEIPLEKIPFTQKAIISQARRHNVGVYVATNLLETMIEKKKPTRAEIQDVVNTLLDGAMGLTLAAETAVGKHPLECINMAGKLIDHAERVLASAPPHPDGDWPAQLAAPSYLLENLAPALIPPHGGKLVNRVLQRLPDPDELAGLPRVRLNASQQMDVEQIAVGAFSPLEGFMGREDFHSVLERMRLANGTAWPLPVVLDVSEAEARALAPGQPVALTDETGQPMAILHLEEKYRFDAAEAARKIYGTDHPDHPGVRLVYAMKPVLLGGRVDLIRGRRSETRAYELTPRQTRRLFDERGWSKVMGFHTRNIPHRGHEHIQLRALEEYCCDGLLVQPVVGKKKPGDFKPEIIMQGYERLVEQYYPRDRVVLAALSTFSRYAGPREALFTALVRKNFGCSHFIIGRDHTGVAGFYDPYASQRVFEQFDDLGMTIARFNEICYSPRTGDYIDLDGQAQDPGMVRMISGTQAREMFLRGECPPEWFMRPEVSGLILDLLRRGLPVFEA